MQMQNHELHVKPSFDTHIKSSLLLQLRLAIRSGNTLKQREYLWRSAEAFDRLGEFTDAEEQLQALQDMELTKEQYLETLCHLADIQVCQVHLHKLS